MQLSQLCVSRTDHIGSLLRPPTLKEAFARRARAEIGDDELHAAQDAAIREVVAKQQAHGLLIVTDGEYRRLNSQVSFSEVVGWDLWSTSWRGMLKNPLNIAPGEKPLTKGADAVVSFRTPATARLQLIKSFPLQEYTFLKAMAKSPAKVTLMGPDRICQMCDIQGSRPVYADSDAFLGDVVAIEKQIVEGLVEAGCDYVQIDEPSYTGYVDPATLDRMRRSGEDPMKNLRRAVDADNEVIRSLTGKAIFGLHVCRGNRASMWHREGGYDAIAETLFGGLKYDRLLLEYDTERAGTFEPLRYVPKGVIAVLGLITTKAGRVETVEELKCRLNEASKYLSIDQIALSPQCGFASGIAGNLVSEDQQWQKLDVMLETARQVWGT